MIGNIIKTIIAFFVYMAVISVVNPLATLITGAVAGNQFYNSATSYLTTSFVFTMNNTVYFLATFGFLVSLFVIWKKKLEEFIAASTALLLLVVKKYLLVSRVMV